MTYLQLQIEAGSEIERTIEPNEFWNLPTVLADLKSTIAHRTERRARAWLNSRFEAVEAVGDNLNFTSLWEVEEPTTHEAAYSESAHEPKEVEEGKTLIAVADKGTELSVSLYSTPKEPAHTKAKPLSTRELKQRLKDYKKRLGSHTQKALKLEREGKRVPRRTRDAITNNEKWVAHYEGLLNALNDEK